MARQQRGLITDEKVRTGLSAGLNLREIAQQIGMTVDACRVAAKRCGLSFVVGKHGGRRLRQPVQRPCQVAQPIRSEFIRAPTKAQLMAGR